MPRLLSHLTLLIVPTLGSSLLTAASPSSHVNFNLPQADSPSSRFNRALACYISDAMTGSHDDRCKHAENFSISTSHLPEIATEQLRSLINPASNSIATNDLREWWGVWSYAVRETSLQNNIIASDLASFEKNTQFHSWPAEIVAPSPAKGKTRVIYRSPASFARNLSVAQTLDTVSPDANAPVIETEVAIDRLDNSGNADFYSYNSQGLLSTTSHFPSGEKQVPSFCIGCHHVPSSGVFSRFD